MATALAEGTYRRHGSALVARLLNYGTDGYRGKTRRRLKTLNAMAYLIVFLSAVYALIYAIEDISAYRWIVLVNLALVAVGAGVPFSHRIHELAGGFLIAASESLALFALVAVLGRESGIQLNLVVGAAAPFVIFGLERLALVAGTVVWCCILHVAAWFLFPPEAAVLSVDGALLTQLYVSSAITAFGVIAALVFYAFHLAEAAEAETEALLRNILPGSVVERLRMRPGEPIADQFAEASVLFSDLQGFVPLTRRLGAARTVTMLNDLVRRFDRLATAHGVEKIKTIGDAYMAVCGIPEPASDHAARLARMALEMQAAARETAERFGIDLGLRIGMALGPVMAGVIGVRKFTYDVWGEPVNLAARLESTGEAGRIHVSSEVRAQLEEAFIFLRRGPTDIKGLGAQETWFLLDECRTGETGASDAGAVANTTQPF